jgi:hypothetical protein
MHFPTSCVVAGAVLSLMHCGWRADLIREASQPRRPVLHLEVESPGFCSMDAFVNGKSNWKTYEPESGPRHLAIALDFEGDRMHSLRLDPLEREGVLRLGPAEIRMPSGEVHAIDWRQWTVKGTARLESVSEKELLLISSGNDPYLAVGGLDFVLVRHAVVPAAWALWLMGWLVASTGLLLYNHLLAEGLSLQELSELKRR